MYSGKSRRHRCLSWQTIWEIFQTKTCLKSLSWKVWYLNRELSQFFLKSTFVFTSWKPKGNSTKNSLRSEVKSIDIFKTSVLSNRYYKAKSNSLRKRCHFHWHVICLFLTNHINGNVCKNGLRKFMREGLNFAIDGYSKLAQTTQNIWNFAVEKAIWHVFYRLR